jgi:hypothetical protein
MIFPRGPQRPHSGGSAGATFAAAAHSRPAASAPPALDRSAAGRASLPARLLPLRRTLRGNGAPRVLRGLPDLGACLRMAAPRAREQKRRECRGYSNRCRFVGPYELAACLCVWPVVAKPAPIRSRLCAMPPKGFAPFRA